MKFSYGLWVTKDGKREWRCFGTSNQEWRALSYGESQGYEVRKHLKKKRIKGKTVERYMIMRRQTLVVTETTNKQTEMFI